MFAKTFKLHSKAEQQNIFCGVSGWGGVGTVGGRGERQGRGGGKRRGREQCMGKACNFIIDIFPH